MQERQQVCITMPVTLVKQADALAKLNYRSRSYILWKAFEEWLELKGEKRNEEENN